VGGRRGQSYIRTSLPISIMYKQDGVRIQVKARDLQCGCLCCALRSPCPSRRQHSMGRIVQGMYVLSKERMPQKKCTGVILIERHHHGIKYLKQLREMFYSQLNGRFLGHCKLFSGQWMHFSSLSFESQALIAGCLVPQQYFFKG
jgi:hypothetical protein